MLQIDCWPRCLSLHLRRVLAERDSMHLEDVAVIGDDRVRLNGITFSFNHYGLETLSKLT